MQITFDISTLTPSQKLCVAEFITDYPTSETAQGNASFDEVIDTVPSFTFPVYVDEAEELPPAPEVSFGLALVPPPPVPVAPLAIPAPLGGIPAGNLDKNGLPWDERIHSSNKAFVADGTWRKRRGVDEALVAQVEAELRVIMSIPAPAPVVLIPAPPVYLPVTSYVAPTLTVVNPTVAAPVPPPPPVPVAAITNLLTATPIVSTVAPITPAVTLHVEPNAYLNLIQLVTDVVHNKKLTRPQVDECITRIDPSLNLQLLSKRPDLIPQISANIRSLVA